ncbi:hypothetical protein ACOME3_000139 [Neoechinorhynchus agilis]
MMRDMFLSWVGWSDNVSLDSDSLRWQELNEYTYEELIELLDAHYTLPIQFVAEHFASVQNEKWPSVVPMIDSPCDKVTCQLCLVQNA